MSLPLLTRTVTLRDGAKMPIIGLGVYEAGDAYRACLSALAVGYRHIDTAQFYENEAEVGKAVRDSKVPRDQVFITTKVAVDAFDRAAASVVESAKKLNVGPIDLVLLHAPVLGERVKAYKELEQLCAKGVVKSIGVSNYGVHHLEELLAQCTIPPAVNQIEVHPFFLRGKIIDFCKQNGIVVQAYSPLARGTRLNNKTIRLVAKELGKSPAQVMLKWGLTKVPVILPKSSTRERQVENADLEFELSEAQQKALDSLAVADGNSCWDPTQWK